MENINLSNVEVSNNIHGKLVTGELYNEKNTLIKIFITSISDILSYYVLIKRSPYIGIENNYDVLSITTKTLNIKIYQNENSINKDTPKYFKEILNGLGFKDNQIFLPI